MIGEFADHVGQALLMALGMFWKVGWSLVLGFALSAILQAVVSKDSMRRALGSDGARQIMLATVAGAASSSCSYASAAISRTLFMKGAALIPTLAFMLASTNLVIELGIVLYLLMGWQFAAGEWLGGVLLISIMSLLVKATYPAHLVEEARHRQTASGGRDHGATAMSGDTIAARLRNRQTWVLVAQNFAMDWSMLWKDITIGFVIAGALSAFIPSGVWQALFVQDAQPWIRLPAQALIGPIVAILSFVCSIGNVPMAAILWGSGVGFGGVLAFLYADLIVLPLLDVYRRYYGVKMAAYIAIIFYLTMALAAILMDAAFSGLGWIPVRTAAVGVDISHFTIDYTFWLNIPFALLAAWLFRIARANPMTHDHGEGTHDHCRPDPHHKPDHG